MADSIDTDNISFCDPIYELCSDLGYTIDYFGREFGFCFERITRPFKYNEHGFCKTKLEEQIIRVQIAIKIPFFLVLSIVSLPFSMFFNTTAFILQKNRLKIIEMPSDKKNNLSDRSISVLSMNTCLQSGPFAPLTGGVTSPKEKFDDEFPTRIEAISEFAAKKTADSSADILCFQEVHDLSALDDLKKCLNEKGFNYFIIDKAPHPIFANSGLFIASKRKIGNADFISYPIKDRSGVTLGAQQGCIVFDVLDDANNTLLTIFNTHLSYGYREKDNQARIRQINDHILPVFSSKLSPCLLTGDFNFDWNNEKLKSDLSFDDNQYTDLFDDTTNGSSRIFDGNLRGKDVSKKQAERVDTAIMKKDDENKFTSVFCKFCNPKINGNLITDHQGLYIQINI